jgi:hypothetical protein
MLNCIFKTFSSRLNTKTIFCTFLQSDYCYEAEQQLKRDIAMSDLGIERYSQRLAAKRIKTEMQPLFEEFSPFSNSETDDGEHEDESSSSSDAESQVIERNSNHICQKESATRILLMIFLYGC